MTLLSPDPVVNAAVLHHWAERHRVRAGLCRGAGFHNIAERHDSQAESYEAQIAALPHEGDPA